MVESEIPLLKGNSVTIDADDLNTYKELLKIQVDPNRILYIRDIKVEFDDTTSLPQFKLHINGTEYLKDIPVFSGAATIGFGGDLRGSDIKDPVKIWVKKTSAGTGAIIISCIVTGIQIPR